MSMKFASALAVTAMAALISFPAFAAADVKGEIVNAIEHADYAAESPAMADVHMHLHHALNCIVGPQGNGFDAKQMNPCANQGGGIIPDTADAKKKATLEAAAAKARDGVASNDIAAAKADATAVSNMLKTIQ